MGNCVSSVIDFFHSSFRSSTSTFGQRQMEVGDSYASTAPQQQPENAFYGIVAQASPSSSTLTKKGPCDVFINHRGCDVKHKLASTIYHTLDLVGVHAFLDVEELELGDSIPQEIHEVMSTAGLHIAIFSESYAESPWCLAELSFMLKTGTPILPVFYQVEPNDLRRVAQGCYAPAFSKHEKKGRYSSSMLDEWKSALQKVSYLSGYMLNRDNDDEGKLLKSVVNSVLRTMKKVPLEVAKHPVAMDEIVTDFERRRQEYIESEQQIQIMGIVGFGGSGKTTLATELFNRKNSFFNHSSFLRDVRDAASKNVLHTKQKKLLEDLRIQNLKSFDNFEEGKEILADRLKSLSVLIVLDDVDHEDQLDALLPPKKILGSGSLVIVTTREGDVLTKWGITSIYKMQPLQHLHAKQLFCWHAFLQPFPQEGFEDLVENCLHVCTGLPLSLKVIGGQLYGKRSKDYWVSQLDKIRRILPEEILQRLKISYNALDKEEQEIFLDIACFFIGERRSSAICVWDGSGWSGLSSWETLQNKCLVEMDEEECIRMHDHLRDLGREIATTHSPSRILFQRESMQFQRGMPPIRGIMAETLHRRPFEDYMEEMRMSNLRIGLQILAVEGDAFPDECGELSGGLLWLRWEWFKQGNIPSWLSLENIRVLQLRPAPWLRALWEDARPPLQLRELLIENNRLLQSLPRSIGRLKHLKRLSLVGSGYHHSKLMILPEEFCCLYSLEHLQLTYCTELSSLPKDFGDLVNLRHLDLSSCSSLRTLPASFKQLIHLEYLNLAYCGNLTLEPDILENITNLKVFDVSWCEKLEELPHNITNQASLGKLYLTYIISLRELPASIGQLSKLKELIINGCPLLTRLPSSLENLSNLVTLRVEDCLKLESLPIDTRQLYSLRTLMIAECPALDEMPSLAGLISLNELHVRDCHKIKKIEGLEHLKSLEKLFVGTRWMVPGIHSLEGPERLRTLNLEAENISAFESCIRSIEIEKWPWEMTIYARTFPGVESILNSFTFPGLAVNNSLDSNYDLSFDDGEWAEYDHQGNHYSIESLKCSLTCGETNLSDAAIACYLVRFVYCPYRRRLVIKGGESSSVELREGEWIVMRVFREVSHLIKGRRLLLQASTSVKYLRFTNFRVRAVDVYGGWLIVGERGSVVEGCKQLFHTLCEATSIT